MKGKSDGSLFDLMLRELESSLGKALESEAPASAQDTSSPETDTFSERGGTKKLLRDMGISVQEMKRVLQELQQSSQATWIAELDKSLQSAELSLRQMQLLLLPYLNLLGLLEKEGVADEAPILTHSHIILVHQDFKNLGTLFHRMGGICTILRKMQDVLPAPKLPKST